MQAMIDESSGFFEDLAAYGFDLINIQFSVGTKHMSDYGATVLAHTGNICDRSRWEVV
jgi:hypothetical protein